jgi:hypothetical protein
LDFGFGANAGCRMNFLAYQESLWSISVFSAFSAIPVTDQKRGHIHGKVPELIHGVHNFYDSNLPFGIVPGLGTCNRNLQMSEQIEDIILNSIPPSILVAL